MRKTKLILSLVLCASFLVGCGQNGQASQSTEIVDISQLGTPDINSAFWQWEKDLSGKYTAYLYLTYYKNADDKVGTEKCYPITPVRNVMKANSCEDEGLDRYTASFLVDGVTIQSSKDVITPAKGHNFVGYVSEGDHHFKECECGLIDYDTPLPHSYVDDDNGKTKTCSDCHDVAFTESYLENKIPNIKNEIAKYHIATSMSDALDHLAVNSTALSVIDALDEGDGEKLTDLEVSKLIASAYNYRTFLDASKYHSYKVDLPAQYREEYTIQDGYEVDDNYYNLRTFTLPETVPSRAVYNKSDGTVISRPDNGVSVDFQATIYNCFEIADFPSIDSIVREIGLYLYVPVGGLQYRFLGYTSYPDSTTKAYSYLNNDTDLAQGWNLISFTDFSAFADITHIFIEIKDDNGAMPAGEYKLTSILSRYDDASKIGEITHDLPGPSDLKFNNFEKVFDTYALYCGLDDKMKSLIPEKGKLISLHEAINGKFSLPYGPSIYLTNGSKLDDPMPYSSIEGNSMYKLATNGASYFSGLIKATEVIPCENQTLGFLTYQEGEYCYGSDGKSDINLKDNLWNDYVKLTTVHIYGSWYLHYVPLNMIDDYVINGAKTIYSANYIRFLLKNIQISKNTNPVYLSTLYSFDMSLI